MWSKGARGTDRRGALQEQIKVPLQRWPAHPAPLQVVSLALDHSLPIRQTGPSEQRSVVPPAAA